MNSNRRAARTTAWALAILALVAPRGLGAQQAAVPVTGTTSATAAGTTAGTADENVLTLEQAIALALENNRDLIDARLSLRGAEGRVREAYGAFFPSLELNSGYTRNVKRQQGFLPAIIFDPDANPDEVIPVPFGSQNEWSFTVTAEQSLFRPAVIVGAGAAGTFRDVERIGVRARAHDVATRTRIAYYDVLLAQEAERLSANSLDRIELTLRETEALFDAGLASEYDALRLRVERNNVEPDVRRSQAALQAAKRTLAIEMGLDAVDSLNVVGSLTGPGLLAGGEASSLVVVEDAPTSPAPMVSGLRDPESRDVEELIAIMLQERADLKRLELTQDLRKAEMRVEQSGFLPELELFGNYAVRAQEEGGLSFFGESERQRVETAAIGLRVNWPIFQGTQRFARIDQRQAAMRRAETAYDLALDRAENDVRTLYDQVVEAHQRAAAQREAVSEAQRGFSIARAQFREGISGQLEVTDSELALRQSEFNYAQAAYDYLVARARLDQAVGVVPLVDTDEPVELPPARLGRR
ncbi:MAG TPA: TolC family protein [Longimicrobiales bacterium]|nr:TolC family protein [Longimicrobiales bacterium]